MKIAQISKVKLSESMRREFISGALSRPYAQFYHVARLHKNQIAHHVIDVYPWLKLDLW
jgi:hypothetical protein